MTGAASSARASSLWRLAAPPIVWAAHFGACYATAVAACGRWSDSEHAGAVPLLVAIWSAVALGALAVCLATGSRGGAVLEPARALDDDTPASRAAFVATTNALLVMVSGLAVMFVAAAAWMVPQCR